MDRDRIAEMQEIIDEYAFLFYEIAQTGLWQIDENGNFKDENSKILNRDYPHHMNNFRSFTDELLRRGWTNDKLQECAGVDYTTVLNNKVIITESYEGGRWYLSIY